MQHSQPQQVPNSYPQQRPRPRRSNTLLIVVASVLVAIIVFSCVGGASFAIYQANRPAPAPVGLGETVTTNHWQLMASNVETTKELVWSPFGNEQAAVGQWLLITASITNVGKENFGINTWDFEVVDSGGATYRHSTEFAAYSYPETKGAKNASSQQVPPGVTMPIILVFDINPAATGLRLVFKQGKNPRIDLGR